MNTKHHLSGFDLATRRHNRDLPKPNEDCMVCDRDNRIFIILDGITRVHREYFADPGKSAACDVDEIFARRVHTYLKAGPAQAGPENMLREAVRLANDEICQYRSRKTREDWGFYPGTLGIVAMIREQRMHYLCAGDCVGMILRGSSRICFGEQLSLSALDIIGISKAERYDIYCNHPENDLSYTIFNGDACVPESSEYGFIDLCPGDTIILATDGIKNYLKYESQDVLLTTPAEQLIDRSEAFDKPPFKTYSDDKSLMIFTYQG